MNAEQFSSVIDGVIKEEKEAKKKKLIQDTLGQKQLNGKGSCFQMIWQWWKRVKIICNRIWTH